MAESTRKIVAQLPQSRALLSRIIKKEPKDTVRIVKEMREDVIFCLGLNVIKSLVASASVTMKANVEDARVKALSEYLLELWNRYLNDSMEAIEYGRQAFELVWTQSRSLGAQVVKEIIPIPYEYTEAKISQNTGRINGVICKGKGLKVTLGPKCFWWAAIGDTPIEPYGKSCYRGAPWKVRQLRKEHEQNEHLWYGRFSLGNAVLRAPSESGGPPVTGIGDVGEVNIAGMPIDPMEVMKDQYENVKKGGAFVLSSLKHPPELGGEYLYDVTALPEIKDNSALISRGQQLDKAGLWSLGVPDRSVIQEGATGSRAVSKEHFEVLCFRVETYLRNLANSFHRDVVRPVVSVNYGRRVQINMDWRPIGDESADRFDTIMQQILTAPQVSPLISEGVFDIAEMGKTAGVPLGPNPQQAIAKVAADSQPSSPATSPAQVKMAMDLFKEAMDEVNGKVRQLGGCC